MIKAGSFDGSFILTDAPQREYIVRTPSNYPYCHFCRNRVEIVTVLDRGDAGNPFHICATCLEAATHGLGTVKDEITRIQRKEEKVANNK